MGQGTNVTAHPLDPLSVEETSLAARAVRTHVGGGGRWRFASIELQEPGKETVATFGQGDPIERAAHVICWNCEDGKAYRAHVALVDGSVSWEELPPGTQPNMTVDEFSDCDAALRNDPRLVEALLARGITDMDLVIVDVWNYGHHLIPDAYRGPSRQS